MKISYDKQADAMALVFREGRISKDMQIAENVFAGFDRGGHLIEIQLLEVSKKILKRRLPCCANFSAAKRNVPD